MKLFVSNAYALGNKQLKWGFSQLQAKKDFVKIWRMKRKVGSACGRE